MTGLMTGAEFETFETFENNATEVGFVLSDEYGVIEEGHFNFHLMDGEEAIKKACEMLKEDPYYFSEEDINKASFVVFDYYTDFEEILL